MEEVEAGGTEKLVKIIIIVIIFAIIGAAIYFLLKRFGLV